MNSIDRWKIADRMHKRAKGYIRLDAALPVEDAVDECVKIVDELVRKTDSPLKSWERDTHKLWSGEDSGDS